MVGQSMAAVEEVHGTPQTVEKVHAMAWRRNANESSLVSVISGGVYGLSTPIRCVCCVLLLQRFTFSRWQGPQAVWRQMSDVGGIAATIAAWTMIFLASAYLCAGLLVSWRYNQHARFKLREKEQVLVIAQSMGQNVRLPTVLLTSCLLAFYCC